MTIYHVKHGEKEFLVDAKTKAQAVAHVVGKNVEVKRIGAADSVAYIQNGLTAEKAGE